MAEQSIVATQKVRFINLDTLEERLAQFNPTELTTSVTAEYTLFTAVGLSHQPHQYSHTTNREFTLTLQFKVERPAEREEVDSTIAFLRSLAYPRVPGGAPSDVLFVWPNNVGLPVKVRSVSEKQVQFNQEGAPTRMDIDVTLMRIRDRPLYQDDVRTRGLQE